MELQVFNSAEFGSVRTTTVNGEVMFVGKDKAVKTRLIDENHFSILT